MAVTFTLEAGVGANPATALVTGQVVNAYKASRFGSAPTTNTAAPGGGADYGPQNSDATSLAGNGAVIWTVTTFEPFYLSFYDPADTSNAGSYNLYWTAALLPNVPDASRPYVASVDQTGGTGYNFEATTIAAGSNGAALPQATINVALASSFASSGSLVILIGGTTPTVVQYTGKTGTSFTGCTGGTGTMTTGAWVTAAHKVGSARRTVYIQVGANNGAAGFSYVIAYSTIAGVLGPVGEVGTTSNASSNAEFMLPFPVDPLGWYTVRPASGGTGGTPFADKWIEVDG